MTAADLHTLTGAYALDALPEEEAREFRLHLAQCEACAQEVKELRRTAARLALAVAEVPPAGLRERVMAALPEVRQLPPLSREAAVVPGAARRWRQRLPYLTAAACLVIAVVAGGLAVDARQQADRQRAQSIAAEQQATWLSVLLAAPDASFHTAVLKGGGSGTVVVSRRLGHAALIYHGLPRLRGERTYELWYSRGGTMVPAGLFSVDRSSGAVLLDGDPGGADGIGITAEPRGGSPRPTTNPLALYAL